MKDDEAHLFGGLKYIGAQAIKNKPEEYLKT